MSFQPHFTARKNKRCLEEENQILRQRLNEYIELENDRLNETNEILNNKLQELNSKYDILQKENEELKNKSKNEVIVPQQPVPLLGFGEQLEEEEYIQDNATDEQLLNFVISADSNAISVPVAIAISTLACVKAGASFIPSPAMATTLPCAWSSLMIRDLSCGKISALTESIPICLAI